MLPRLQLNADVDPVVVRFLDELKQRALLATLNLNILAVWLWRLITVFINSCRKRSSFPRQQTMLC